MSRSRHEFTKAVKGQRYVHCKGRCEGCGCDLAGKRAEYDHEIADGAGGKPTFENCRVLCSPCHREKTGEHDQPLVAKVKRQSAMAAGAKPVPARPIVSAPFPISRGRKANPTPLPARRSMYAEGR